MTLLRRVLVANRGEIAIRVMRACQEEGLASVAIFSSDDSDALHVRRADDAVGLPGRGTKAYLDIPEIVAAATRSGCNAVHPGYGFLSESAAFARACGEAGLVFVGPTPETLGLFGDKAKARALAQQEEVPIAKGTIGETSLADARIFFAAHEDNGIMVKALAGGGGRGIRAVRSEGELEEAWGQCSSEALAAFGESGVYVEELIGRARHIEVQIVGDGRDVTHLSERECSVQRRNQKLIEIAPSPWLPEDVRRQAIEAALRLGRAARYRGVGTVEFLVEIDGSGTSTGRCLFMELNPRIQVEHTVTEEVTGVDLVVTQLRIASGALLGELNWPAAEDRVPRSFAIQLRVNMEQVGADGSLAPSAGTLLAFDPPNGPGIRVETAGYQGYRTGFAFDSLLAKVIAHSGGAFEHVVGRAYRGLGEFRINGVDTNKALLQSILQHPDFLAGRVDTAFVERHLQELVASASEHRDLFPPSATRAHEPRSGAALAWAGSDPVLSAPSQGQVTAIAIAPGERFAAGQVLATIEAMKMEQSVRAEQAGIVAQLIVEIGAIVVTGEPILSYVVNDEGDTLASDGVAADNGMQDALKALHAKRRSNTDESRPAALSLARKRDLMTARDRIEQLVDRGSFSEIGGLAFNPGEETRAPADGVVTGRARIDGRPTLVLSQDFSVLGGSAGHLGMLKMERIADLALEHGLPLVMLLDGGGHRIQDGQNSRDYAAGAPLFQKLVDLSGWVPVTAAILGAGFAANTNFAGCADFVVMVRGKSVMGLAGPPLVKAGIGETITAEELGGAGTQVDRHGLAHLGVDDEEAALHAIRTYLSYLPGNAAQPAPWSSGEAVIAPDTTQLETIVPANTRHSYDMRRVIGHVADMASFFEIMPTFATNLVVGFARLEGRSVGIVANQPAVMAGMLDAGACEKGAHFVATCDAFGLPLVYLIDVPGFSIGSAAERSTLGRRSARLLQELGVATVPRVSVVLRKGYGLAYIAMCGGRSFGADAAFAWPTAEICAMSVEGAIDVAYHKIYVSAEDPPARRKELIDKMRAGVSPQEAAAGFGIDDLIAPAETRSRLIEALLTAPMRRLRPQRRLRSIPPI